MKKPNQAIDARSVELIRQVREIIQNARTLAGRSIDAAQVSMSYAIGQRIVEHEQKGEHRAAYGQKVIAMLSKAMSAEFGRGFSARNLALMRKFYVMYSPRITKIAPTRRRKVDFAVSDCKIC
ncbi:MAG: DUF1016 N-terminal domain-containing protein [Tannerella sp.]|jgi:hypothetical protein|nr:DUF1016 N-terminal domain-containing protein [Tannerella sp.]